MPRQNKGTVVMSLRMENGAVLKRFFEALKPMVEMARFTFEAGQVSSAMYAEARTVFIYFSAPSSSFDDYRCEESIDLDINIDELDKILKSCGEDESVTIEYLNVPDEEGEELLPDNKIFIKVKGRSGAVPRRNRSFTLALEDLSEDLVVKDATAMGNSLRESAMWSVEIDDSVLEDVLKDAERVADFLGIAVDKDKITFKNSGDIGTYNEEFDDSVEISELAKGAVSVDNKYQLLPLKNLAKMTHESGDNIVLRLGRASKDGKDIPSPVWVSIGNILNGGKMDYYLAPQAEDKK